MMVDQAEKDECYRCGYDLRGIADDAPCPECGLLAKRSRRPTDELHNTRPRWLGKLSGGIVLILLAIISPFIGIFAGPILTAKLRFVVWRTQYEFLPFDLLAVILPLGVFLLTTKEGYPPADQADQRLRRWLRLLSLVPMLMMMIAHTALQWALSTGDWRIMDDVGEWIPLFFVSASPFPMLLFLHLRGLAKRARSAHLAEHCLIVGIGSMLSLLYISAVIFVGEREDQLGLPPGWEFRSNAWLVILLVMAVASALFMLWHLYLLVRFALGFRSAVLALRRKWTADDRSLNV